MPLRPPTQALWEAWTLVAAPPLRGGASKFIRAVKSKVSAHPTSNPHAAPSTSPLAQSLRTLVESVGAGVFRSLRSGSSALPEASFRLSPRPAIAHFARAVRPAARRTFGGPSPRPIAHPSHTSHVGIGAARNFSSSQGVFQNVVHNVPLGLRALVDADGIDERRWQVARREIRRSELKSSKGVGRAKSEGQRQQERFAEFRSFFGPNPSSNYATTSSAPIILVLPLEPTLSFPPSLASSTDDPSSYRLLPPHFLSSIASLDAAYTSHANRLRTLSNRLTNAGAFDDPDVAVLLVWGNEAKQVQVSFGGNWERRDVEQAIGAWRDEGAWWEILDPHEGGRSMGSSSLECDSRVGGGEEEEHDLVASTFVLPAPALSVFGTPSPASSHWSGEQELDGVLWEFGAEEQGGTEQWWSDGASEVWGASSEGSYESGVRTFLEELKDVERERGFRRAEMVA